MDCCEICTGEAPDVSMCQIVPCGHRLCVDCALRVKRHCPFCRGTIRSTIPPTGAENMAIASPLHRRGIRLDNSLDPFDYARMMWRAKNYECLAMNLLVLPKKTGHDDAEIGAIVEMNITTAVFEWILVRHDRYYSGGSAEMIKILDAARTGRPLTRASYLLNAAFGELLIDRFVDPFGFAAAGLRREIVALVRKHALVTYETAVRRRCAVIALEADVAWHEANGAKMRELSREEKRLVRKIGTGYSKWLAALYRLSLARRTARRARNVSADDDQALLWLEL